VQRKCRYIPLQKQPLALVLGQVRFSPVRQMATYIPQIQEDFRQRGFPHERAGTVQQLVFSPGGDPPLQTVTRQRWEYRTKGDAWSILVTENSVVVQTTAYERFEAFADTFVLAARVVLTHTDQTSHGVVDRVGLRYVNVVEPQEGEDFRAYLRRGFHGPSDSIFRSGTHRLHVESVGQTDVGGDQGTLVVRVTQNDQGFFLPPDLVDNAPRLERAAKVGDILTLVDMDHFIGGELLPDAAHIAAQAYALHDHIIESFHEHVVSKHAIEVWR
jgi:uncharacterized protein (TIGR04255 family)